MTITQHASYYKLYHALNGLCMAKIIGGGERSFDQTLYLSEWERVEGGSENMVTFQSIRSMYEVALKLILEITNWLMEVYAYGHFSKNGMYPFWLPTLTFHSFHHLFLVLGNERSRESGGMDGSHCIPWQSRHVHKTFMQFRWSIHLFDHVLSGMWANWLLLMISKD